MKRIFSAGAVVIHRFPHEIRFLLLRAYNNWDFPKGMVEEGETPLEGALREVREETGITGLRFPWGEEYRETEPYGRGKVARYYLAESSGATVRLLINPALGRPEHHEYRWATAQEAVSMLPPRLVPILEWAREVVEERA